MGHFHRIFLAAALEIVGLLIIYLCEMSFRQTIIFSVVLTIDLMLFGFLPDEGGEK